MPQIVSCFPTPDEVFADPDWMPRVLASVAVVETDDGTSLPVVISFEPMHGRLGEHTRDVLTVFASRNRMGFRLTPEGRLDFLGDPLFFELLHRAEHGEPSRSLSVFYGEQYAGLAEAQRAGRLPAGCLEFSDPDLDWLDDLVDVEALEDFDQLDDVDGPTDRDALSEPAVASHGAGAEFMPDGTEFTKLATIDPTGLLPRSTTTFTLWWEPESSTVLITCH